MTETDTIDAQLLDLMLRAGSRWVLWLMIGLSFAAIAVMLERAFFYLQERTPSRQLEFALQTLRSAGPEAALKKLAGARSMPVAVVRTLLVHAAQGPDAVEEHKTAKVEHERMRYEQRIAFLGTLGNNAPFVGLFGTVLGIIRAFSDLAAGGGKGTEAVMSGIAEALVATGVGLLVALPAVAAYNVFVRRVDTAVATSEAYAHQVLAHLKALKAEG